jgi:hypothetical protein
MAKKIDLGLIREKRGEIVMPGGKIVTVRAPRIRQILEFEGIRGEYMQEAKKLEEEGKLREAFIRQNEFFVKELTIFVPELTREDVLDMTREQRDAISEMIFPEKEKATEEETKKNEGLVGLK